MKTLPSAITNLKNQLAVNGAWLTLLYIYYPDIYYPTVDYHYVNDNILPYLEITGLGIFYPASFQIQQISEEVQMSLPKITINIYDPELKLKDDLQANAGMSGGTVILRRIYRSQAGVVTDIGIRQDFTILDVNVVDTIVSLSIGIADPLARRFPRDNYGALTCRHKYKGGFCRYNDNLIKNPSFEDATITPWIKWASPTIWGQSSNHKKYGNYSVHTRSTVDNGGVQQTFSVKPNTTYTLSCWIYMLNAYISTATIRAMTLVTGSSYSKALADKTLLDQWQQVSIEFTTAATQTTATVWLGGIGEAYFDYVTVLISTCTHTLEDAPDGTPGCRSHNNSNQFGGSPGAAEGIFYDRR